MKFHLDTSDVFVPDGLPLEKALDRTTHLAVSAHQDDLEIMAASPILECYQKSDLWFTGVVMTDGRGSPRSGLYEGYSDEDMRTVRFKEQHKAAFIGEYAAQVMLDYPSKSIKDPAETESVQDLVQILEACHPRYIYTHNLTDKHDTHVGTALKLIRALNKLPKAARPERLFGCEVWRDLDWMVDQDKVAFDLSRHENLQAALLGVFDSQIEGGKRYDLASMGRRRANATYYESHGVDVATGMSFAMDMTPLIGAEPMELIPFIQDYIQHFSLDVRERLKRLG